MKIMRNMKTKSLLPILSLVFPCIPAAVAIIQAASILSTGLTNIYLIVAVSSIALTVTLPVCGSAGLLCSILAFRKLGRTKRIIAAIVWNGLNLLLSIPLLYMYLS